MIVYQNNTKRFVESVRNNSIAEEIKANFLKYFSCNPSMSEYNSWANSLSRVRDLIEKAELFDNHVVVEYEVPYNQSRIDCMLFGKSKQGDNNVVLMELKQWSDVKSTDDIGNFVETYVGGGIQTVPHPSQQVKGYHNYLLSYIAEFETKDPLLLSSLAYCHNYRKKGDEGLYAEVYHKLIEEFPLYCANDTDTLAEKLKTLLSEGNGTHLFNRFMVSDIRPSKKLLENVTRVINNEPVFALLDDQLVAKNLIWSKIRKNKNNKGKSVIIVHGGPGTGKSVIALNLVAEVASRGGKVYWGCKSKPFMTGIQTLIGKKSESMFNNLYRYIPSKFQENQADVLFVDEAHRIERTSNHFRTRKEDKTNMPQVDQLIRAAHTSVFFIDDHQAVRKSEIGSSITIKEAAKKLNAEVFETVLKNQYRCMGSNNYLEWLHFILGYTTSEKVLYKAELFEFKIFDSPTELYTALGEKEAEKPNSARLMAGFCWPWSKVLDKDGNQIKDVVIEDFRMPWETHLNMKKIPAGYVSWDKWAISPEGFKQVGCIYTSQGFEFDYAGVIFADDLRFDITKNCLVGNKDAHKDPTLTKGTTTEFDVYVRNIYRVLMSRGLKGCYVYFLNPETRKYFEKYIEI